MVTVPVSFTPASVALEGCPEPALRLRPYALSGGRTATSVDLPLNALIVRVTGSGAPDRLPPAQRRLLHLLNRPLAVIEIATRVDVPVPVARVLVGDLVELGLVRVEIPPPEERPDIRLLRTVLENLHDR